MNTELGSSLRMVERIAERRRNFLRLYLESSAYDHGKNFRSMVEKLYQDMKVVEVMLGLDGLTEMAQESRDKSAHEMAFIKPVSWKEFSYDPNNMVGRLHVRESRLTPIEGVAYHLLILAQGIAVAKGIFANNLGDPLSGDVPILGSHISNIRLKLEGKRFLGAKSHFQTVRNVGYKLVSCQSD